MIELCGIPLTLGRCGKARGHTDDHALPRAGIREATLDDAPRLVEMATRFLLETRYGAMFDNRATPVTIGGLVEQVLRFGAIFVAEVTVPYADGSSETKLIGMLAIVVVPHPLTGLAYADEIAWWVEPEHRGGSIGPHILRSAETWARQKGANMVKLVAPAGSRVGTFYERVGYQAVETAFIKTI